MDQIPAMIVLRPGDRVLVTLTDDPEEDMAQEFARVLHESFPGTEFIIMGGVAGLLVQSGTAPKKPVRRRGAN